MLCVRLMSHQSHVHNVDLFSGDHTSNNSLLYVLIALFCYTILVEQIREVVLVLTVNT